MYYYCGEMTLAKPDLLPEDVEWCDEGCEFYPSCLDCPFSRCLEEEPRGRQRLRMVTRAGEMARLKREGTSTDEIARLFGVSKRTVQRAIATNERGRRSAQ